jgi:hypothetical protein
MKGGRREGGRLAPTATSPHKHSSRPTPRPADIPAGKYSRYSGQPTLTGRYSDPGRLILWELAPGSQRGGRVIGAGGEGEEEGKKGGKGGRN